MNGPAAFPIAYPISTIAFVVTFFVCPAVKEFTQPNTTGVQTKKKTVRAAMSTFSIQHSVVERNGRSSLDIQYEKIKPILLVKSSVMMRMPPRMPTIVHRGGTSERLLGTCFMKTTPLHMATTEGYNERQSSTPLINKYKEASLERTFDGSIYHTQQSSLIKSISKLVDNELSLIVELCMIVRSMFYAL